VKNLVLHNIDPHTTTVGALKQLALEKIHSLPAFAPFRAVTYDTLKRYTAYQGCKPNNLVVNLENDDNPHWWLRDDNVPLASLQCFENESEWSFFNAEDYNRYKSNPSTKW